MSSPTSTITNETVLQAIISHFLNVGAKAESDTRWLIGVLPGDLLEFFRVEVLAAIRQKGGSPARTRKIYLSLGKTARQIFGPAYARVKNDLDKESKAAARKTDNQ